MNTSRMLITTLCITYEKYRFGPGRLSRRLQQTERLRELRSKNRWNSRSVCDNTSFCPGPHGWSRGSTSSHEYDTNAKQTKQDPLGELTLTQKGDRATHLAHVVTNDQTTGTNWVRGDNFIKDSLGLSRCGGTSSQQHVINANSKGSDRHSARWSSRASVREGAIGNIKRLDISHSTSSANMSSSVIHAVKSAPALLKSRRSGQRNVPLSQGKRKAQQHGTDDPLAMLTKCGTFITAAISSSQTENSTDFDASHSGNDRMGATPGGKALVMKPRLGLPSVADACGGVVLRLSPSERPLDPWDYFFAPLRAICDIEASLSRAGTEYRGVIPAVAEGQELMSQNQLKVCLMASATRNVDMLG